MIKSGLTLFCLLVLLGCQTKTPSYAESYINCEENKQNLKITDDTTIISYIPPEFIIGYELPHFSIETINGRNITTQSLKGKLSIINFWFGSCPPCIAEIPGLDLLKEKYGTRNVNYIAISTDRTKDVRYYIEKYPFNFEHVADGNKIYRETFNAKWGFPFTIISDRNNKILESFAGGPTDSTAIEKVISKIEPILLREKAKR